MSPEPSFGAASSRASSEGLRASAQGHGRDALGQRTGAERPRVTWQGLGDGKGRAVGHRQAGSSSGSDLDISCLVDNTPFKVNEVRSRDSGLLVYLGFRI